MAGAGLGGRFRRLLPPSRAVAPPTPPPGEAAASIAGRLQPYIGELPLNPRQPSRYAERHRDDAQALRVYHDILRDERCQAALDQRLDDAATTILGQSSTTDQRPWRRAAEVQRDVRDETVAADCRLLEGALGGSVATWLTQWNFPGAAPRRIRRDVAPPEDLDAHARREAIVARTSGLRPSRAHIERTYGGTWEDAPPASG